MARWKALADSSAEMAIEREVEETEGAIELVPGSERQHPVLEG